MIEDLFTAICFFLLGFNFILGLVCIFIYFLYGFKTYKYYVAYLYFAIAWVGMVFAFKTNLLQQGALKSFISLAMDPFGVMVYYFYAQFCFQTLLSHNPENKKHQNWMNLYSLLVVVHVLICFFAPNFIKNHGLYYPIFRGSILVISIFLLNLMLKRKNQVFYRYISLGSVLLISFTLWGFVSSTVQNTKLNFQEIGLAYMGIILENICFVFALVTHIIANQRKKKAQSTIKKSQLLAIEQEIYNHIAQNFGREIHDNVGQKVILAGLSLKQLSLETTEQSISSQVEEIGRLLDQTLLDLRGISRTMTTPLIDNKSIVEILEEKCAKMSKNVPCSFGYDPEIESLNLKYKTKIVIFRIVQEFFQNSLKKSSISHFDVQVSIENQILNLKLFHDGVSESRFFEDEREILMLKKRAQLLGGKLYFESDQNTGTKLILELPIKKQIIKEIYPIESV